MNYYKSELEKVKVDGEYPATFQIKSDSGNTKNLNLNKESAKQLIEWLERNYNRLHD